MAATEAIAPAPNLTDLWEGRARFVVDTAFTGLPLGESDTVVLPNGTLRAYLHASTQSLGVLDQCRDTVAFPGCVVTFHSHDSGRTFTPTTLGDTPPVCLLACAACPCLSERDHVDQQQYPRIAYYPATAAAPIIPSIWLMVYEYRAAIYLRRSADGLNWTPPEALPLTRIWQRWMMDCRPEERVGPHPFARPQYACLAGSPPGIYINSGVDGSEAGTAPEAFVFVGLGQNPGSMGCYHGPPAAPAALWRQCSHNPLFTGATGYGDPSAKGTAANASFDFRTISSAEVLQNGSRYFMFYEGVREPGPGDAGDTQFGLGFARSQTARIDGPWERYPGNPLLVDLPGNVGIGHADVIVYAGVIYLYTSLDGRTRSRLRLTWKQP